jgi:hypothetical protein
MRLVGTLCSSKPPRTNEKKRGTCKTCGSDMEHDANERTKRTTKSCRERIFSFIFYTFGFIFTAPKMTMGRRETLLYIFVHYTRDACLPQGIMDERERDTHTHTQYDGWIFDPDVSMHHAFYEKWHFYPRHCQESNR